MRYRVLSASNTLILACFFSGLGILLAIVCLVAGINRNAFENASVVTFDTTALRASLSNDSHTAPIADWYTLHMTTVCSGSWTPGSENLTLAVTKEKENSTMICTDHGVSWHFQLGSILSGADSPSDPALTTINDKLSTNMGVPAGLLVSGASIGFVALLGLFATSFKHGFGPSTHIICVASVITEFVSAILTLAGAASLTAARASLTSSKNTPAGIQSFTSSSFMTLLWIAALVPLVAGGIGIIGQHKEKRMHAAQPKAPPIKVPSVSSTSSGGSSNNNTAETSARKSISNSASPNPSSAAARDRAISDATVVSNGRIRAGSTASYGATKHSRRQSSATRHTRNQSSLTVAGGRPRADSQGVASLRLSHVPSSSTVSAASVKSAVSGGSGLPPTGGSLGGRRYGV